MLGRQDCSQAAVVTDEHDLPKLDAHATETVATAMEVDRVSSTREVATSLGGKAAENEYLEMGVDRDDAECLSPLQSRGPASQFHSLDMEVDLAADECRLPLQSSDSVAAERGNLPSAPFAGTTNEQPLAQSVAQLLCNWKVLGSNLAEGRKCFFS